MKFIGVFGMLMLSAGFGACTDYQGDSGDGGISDAVDGTEEEKDGGDGKGDEGGDLGGDMGGDSGGDLGGDELPTECERFISALADCPYQYVTEIRPGACPRAVCMNSPCTEDDDCPLAGSSDNGDLCVLGNCVYCWEDAGCGEGFACRGGRCVDVETNPCGNNPPCSGPRCSMVSVSERPCPVCVCDSIFQIPCEEDMDCLVISSHPYRRCVYGRCADCKDDTDCSYGNCLPPGMCFDMQPHPEALYGAWLIGWIGALEHFSYFRFEPDGTLRRGMYTVAGAWADDIPALPCWPDDLWPRPLVGTWEPEVTASGFLVVRMSLNLPCDDGAGWSTRYNISLQNDGSSASFQHVDGDQHYQGWRVPVDSCTPDFTTCSEPTYP